MNDRQIIKYDDYFELPRGRPLDCLVQIDNIKNEYKKRYGKIYRLRQWQNLSATVRKKADYVCQKCKKESATVAHHIEKFYFISGKYGYFDLQLMLDEDNCIAVCDSCHRNMEGAQGAVERKFHSPCGHPIIDKETECSWCSDSQVVINKPRTKRSSGKTLRDARKAAKDYKKLGYKKIDLWCDWFLKKTQPFMKKDTTLLDDIRDYIESLGVGKEVYNPEGRFKLLPWQLIVVVYAFGPRVGIPFPKSILVTMARKNGKTTLTAAFVMAFAKYAQSAVNSIDLTATKQGQAAEVMVKALRRIIHNTYPGSVSSPSRGLVTPDKAWTVPKKSAYYAPTDTDVYTLSSEPETADGRDPLLCVVDEAAQVKDEYYTVVNTSKSAKTDQCFIYISTLSENESGWFKRTIDGVLEDLKVGRDINYCPMFFFVDKDEFDIKDEKMWTLTNPSLGYMQTKKELRAAQADAVKNPADRVKFLMKNCNMSGMTEKPMLCDSHEALRVIQGRPESEIEAMLKANQCVIGIDVGVSSGMFAVCLMTRVDLHIFAKFKHFICSNSFDIRKSKIRVLQHFVDRGELVLSGTKNVHIPDVMSYIESLANEYDIVKYLADVSSGGNSITDEMTAKFRNKYEELRIGLKDKHFPSNMIKESIMENRLHVVNNQLFRWELGNAGLKVSEFGDQITGEKVEGCYEIVRLMASSFNGIDGIWALGHSVIYLREKKIQENTPDDVWDRLAQGDDYGRNK